MGTIRTRRTWVKPDTPTHIQGIREGNEGPCLRQAGHHEDGTADARRATGVLPRKHNPIMPVMPNISPG